MIRADALQVKQALDLVKPAGKGGAKDLPILSQVLISANGQLEFTSSNLELTITSRINTEAEHGFMVCTPLDRLHNIACNAGGILELSHYEKDCKSRLAIEDSTGTNELATMEAYDYPPVPMRCNGDKVLIQTKDFIKAVKTVVDKASSDNTRLNLNGVMFNGESRELQATDGHRLAICSVDWLPKKVKALVPRNSLKGTLSALNKAKKHTPEIQLQFDKDYLWIDSEAVQIVIRLMTGDYPDIDKVRHVEGSEVTANKKDLIKAINLVKLTANPRIKAIELWFELGRIAFQSESDIGTGATIIRANVHESLYGHVACVNHVYLRKAIDSCNSQVVLTLVPNEKPFPIKVDEEIVMPMDFDHEKANRPEVLDRDLFKYIPETA